MLSYTHTLVGREISHIIPEFGQVCPGIFFRFKINQPREIYCIFNQKCKFMFFKKL